jgi:hypothetical protein
MINGSETQFLSYAGYDEACCDSISVSCSSLDGPASLWLYQTVRTVALPLSGLSNCVNHLCL